MRLVAQLSQCTSYWSEGASTESYSYLLLSYAVVRQQTSLLLSPPFSHRVHTTARVDCGDGGFAGAALCVHQSASFFGPMERHVYVAVMDGPDDLARAGREVSPGAGRREG